jgi:hypothetical protein
MYNTKIFSFLLITSGLLVASENSSQASETKTITLSYQAKKIIEMSENFNPDQIDTLITFLENKNSEEIIFQHQRSKLQEIIDGETHYGIGFGQDWKNTQSRLSEERRPQKDLFLISPYLGILKGRR